MRRLSLLLCALLVAGAAYGVRFVPGVTEKLVQSGQIQAVLANSGTCLTTDGAGAIFDDGYGSAGFQITDPYWPPSDPRYHHNVFTDVKAWRARIWVGSDYSYHCVHAYYASVWDNDGTPAEMQAHINIWTCGTFIGGYTSPNVYSPSPPSRVSQDYVWASQVRVATTGVGDAGTWSPIWWATVTLPDGESIGLNFFDYGQIGVNSGGCGNQVENKSTQAWTTTWQNSCDGTRGIYADTSQCGSVVYVNEARMN